MARRPVRSCGIGARRRRPSSPRTRRPASVSTSASRATTRGGVLRRRASATRSPPGIERVLRDLAEPGAVLARRQRGERGRRRRAPRAAGGTRRRGSCPRAGSPRSCRRSRRRPARAAWSGPARPRRRGGTRRRRSRRCRRPHRRRARRPRRRGADPTRRSREHRSSTVASDLASSPSPIRNRSVVDARAAGARRRARARGSRRRRAGSRPRPGGGRRAARRDLGERAGADDDVVGRVGQRDRSPVPRAANSSTHRVGDLVDRAAVGVDRDVGGRFVRRLAQRAEPRRAWRGAVAAGEQRTRRRRRRRAPRAPRATRAATRRSPARAGARRFSGSSTAPPPHAITSGVGRRGRRRRPRRARRTRKPLLALGADRCRRTARRRGRDDELVGVDERPAEQLGAALPDGGLARAHQPDEHEVPRSP